MSLAAVVLAFAAAAPAGACRGQSAWEQGTAGAALPRHRCGPAVPEPGRFLVACASAENPWKLPGVVQTVVECFARRGRHLVRLRWDRLGADRYAEDEIEAALGAAVAGLPVYAHLIGACGRICAEGFPVRTAWIAGGALSADPLPPLSIQAQWTARVARGDETPVLPWRGGWLLTASVGDRGISIVAVLDGTRGGERFVRLGLLLDCPGRLRLLLGTRTDTGEVSGGIQRGGAVLVAVSWRMHPVLGTSIAAGAGVMFP